MASNFKLIFVFRSLASLLAKVGFHCILVLSLLPRDANSFFIADSASLQDCEEEFLVSSLRRVMNSGTRWDSACENEQIGLMEHRNDEHHCRNTGDSVIDANPALHCNFTGLKNCSHGIAPGLRIKCCQSEMDIICSIIKRRLLFFSNQLSLQNWLRSSWVTVMSNLTSISLLLYTANAGVNAAKLTFMVACIWSSTRHLWEL